MGPKRQTNKKRVDTDDELLTRMEAVARQAVAEQAVEAAKKKALEKAAEKAAAKAAADEKAKKDAAAATNRPIYVDEVAHAIATKANVLQDARGKCWLSFALNLFLMSVLKTGIRRIYIRHASAPIDGEPVESFAVYDDPKDPHTDESSHSWNIFSTASGTYCVDMSLRQYPLETTNGFKRDAAPEEGWVPTKGLSRLLLGNGTRLQGILSQGYGIVPPDGVTPTQDFQEATFGDCMRFLHDARGARFSNMTAGEQKAARRLHTSKRVSEIFDLLHALTDDFLSSA